MEFHAQMFDHAPAWSYSAENDRAEEALKLCCSNMNLLGI